MQGSVKKDSVSVFQATLQTSCILWLFSKKLLRGVSTFSDAFAELWHFEKTRVHLLTGTTQKPEESVSGIYSNVGLQPTAGNVSHTHTHTTLTSNY